MPHDKKRLARELSRRTGMSYQAALNSLNGAPPEPVVADHHLLDLPARIYGDLGQLVRDLQAHLVGNPVERVEFGTDAHARTLGFATEKHKWHVTLTGLKKSGESEDPVTAWCRGITRQGDEGRYEGWRRLADRLNRRDIEIPLADPDPALLPVLSIEEADGDAILRSLFQNRAVRVVDPARLPKVGAEIGALESLWDQGEPTAPVVAPAARPAGVAGRLPRTTRRIVADPGRECVVEGVESESSRYGYWQAGDGEPVLALYYPKGGWHEGIAVAVDSYVVLDGIGGLRLLPGGTFRTQYRPAPMTRVMQTSAARPAISRGGMQFVESKDEEVLSEEQLDALAEEWQLG